jgi:hypothetical protein
VSLADHLDEYLASPRVSIGRQQPQPTLLGASMNPLDYFIANAALDAERVREFAACVRSSGGFSFMTDED